MINVFSPNWDPYDSYGRLANELRGGLEAAGESVQKFDMSAPVTAIKPALGGFLLGYPSLHCKFGPLATLGPRVAITMFESTEIPNGWVEPLNACDAVIVPAQFLVEVFRDCGVQVPIHVVPLGVSDIFTTFTDRPSREFGYWYNGQPRGNRQPFTFLAIADRGERKGWNEAANAFVNAFGDDSRYRLILKARNFPLKINNPNIKVVREDLTDRELLDLYAQAHVMVFPTKGEGFGLPPREFAASGGLSLVTEWGGTADDLREWGLPLPYDMAPAWKTTAHLRGLGEWAEPDVEAMSALMRHVAENYSSYRPFIVKAAGFVQSQYRWRTFARRCLSIYNDVRSEYDTNQHTAHALTAQA